MFNKISIGVVLCSLAVLVSESNGQRGGYYRPGPRPPYNYPHGPYPPAPYPPAPYPPAPYPPYRPYNPYYNPYNRPPYPGWNRGQPHRVFSVDGKAEEIDHVDAIVDSDLDVALSEGEFEDVIIVPTDDKKHKLVILSPTELVGADKLIYSSIRQGGDDEDEDESEDEDEKEELNLIAVDEDGDGKPEYFVYADE